MFEYLALTKAREGHNSQLKIVEKNKRELTAIYADGLPLLNFRRRLFHFWARVQHFCYLVISSKPFENLSLAVIILNTVFMIISDPNDEDSILNQSEMAFFVIYTVELSLKMLGMGLLTKKIGFFRNGWNTLDFFIVGGSLVNILLKDLNLNLSALRSLRVLRPLKTVSSVKSLKNIILTIFSSLPFLKDIYIILFFFFFLFGIAGLHLFQGVFHQQCFDPVTNAVAFNNPISQTGYCDTDASCPGESVCLSYYANPYFGQTSYDNAIMGTLMSFQVSTTENWSTMMYSLSSAFTAVMSAVTTVYFIFIIVVLNFVVGNLMLAVIVVKFNETHEKIEKEQTEQVHSEFCNCSSGFNYAQMKICGYFLSLSNLKSTATERGPAKRFVYDLKNSLRPPSQSEFDQDFRFVVVETLRKEKKPTASPGSNGLCLLTTKRVGERRDSKKINRGSLRNTKSWRWGKKTTRVAPLRELPELGGRESIVVQRREFQPVDTLEAKPLIEDEEGSDRSLPSLPSVARGDFLNVQAQNEPVQRSAASSVSYSFNERKREPKKLSALPKRLNKTITLEIPKVKRVQFAEASAKNEDNNSIPEETLDPEFQEAVTNSVRSPGVDSQNLPSITGRGQVIIRRRNAKCNLYQRNEPRNSARLSLRPLLLDVTEPVNEEEKLTLKKEQIKAEKEFNAFTNSALSLLKLDLDYCKTGFDQSYQEMEDLVLPSQALLRAREEQEKKKSELVRTRITMVYNTKYIEFPKRKAKVEDSDGELSESAQSRSNLGNSGITQQSSLASNLQSINRDKPNLRSAKPKLVLYEDLGRLANFYFYAVRCSYLIYDVHERQKPNLPSQLQLNSDGQGGKKMRPATCKHKSKNFLAISNFFAEEFEQRGRGEIGLPLSVNEMLFAGLLSDCLQKQKIIHTNWSGNDVQSNPASKANKTVLVFQKLNTQVYEMWLPGALGKFNIFRRMIRQFFQMTLVDFFFIGLVLLNTVVLALNGLVSNDSGVLDQINLVLTIIFTIEICLKFVGLGPVKFSQDVFNIFDAVIVSLSLTEILLGGDSHILSAIKVIRVLRTVRVLRVSRILRTLKFMRTLIRIFQITLDQFMFITLLLLLFLTIFSLIGMQFYAGTWTFIEPGEIIQQNFETFFDAFLVMVDIMTVVNWNDTLVLLARTNVNYAISCVFLIVWIFIGNYILLNLFTAVLLDGFSSAVVINQLEDLNNEFEGIERAVNAEIEKQQKKGPAEGAKPETLALLGPGKSDADVARQKEAIKSTIIYNYDHRVNKMDESEEPRDVLQERLRNDDVDASLSSTEQDISRFLFKNPKKTTQDALMLEQVVCQESLFLFPKESFPRIQLIRMVTSAWFENFILLIIFVSSLHLVVSTWSDHSWEGSTFQAVLDIVDISVNVIFFVECGAKIVAFGFFWCEGSYLRDNWSILDFFIVCTSVLDMALKNSNIQFLGVIKIVRTLRPLRVLSHNPNLKIVVQCLFQSFTGIMNVAVVVLMVWLMYGILGMNLIGGKLGYCQFPDARSYFNVNETLCPELGGSWAVWGANFDNIFSSMSTIFVFSNGENWNVYNYQMMNGDDPAVGPSFKATSWIAYFTLLIIFTSTFFLTKLFIGVIYSEFANEQEKLSKQNFRVISDDQIKWIQMQKMIRAASPNYVEVVVPQNRARLAVYRLVVSNPFEWFILAMILLNMVALAMVYETMNPLYAATLNKVSYVFSAVFTLEAVLKLLAFGPSAYFASNWNKFDFLIVVISILDIVLSDLVNIQGVSVYPIIGRIMRIMRVTRLFKIMKSKRLEGINKIIKTLFYSIPAILNVTLVLFLVYFIYAVLGVFLFKSYDPGFANFLTAFIFLFKCSTGESWPDFMYFDEGFGVVVGAVFWHSFMFLTTFTLMNLFMSVIIDQFSNFYFNADNPINSFEEIVEEFRVCWLLFTSRQRGDRIKNRDLLNFFICLKSPLGFHIPVKKERPEVYGAEFSVAYFQNTLKFDLNYVRRKVSEMKLIEDRQGYISFGQVLHAALKNAFGKNCYKNTDSDTYKEIRKIELKTVAKLFNKRLDDYEVEGGEENRKIRARVANPFNNVLFSQMVFQIWYGHAKADLGAEEVSSDDLEELLNRNPDHQFDRQVVRCTRERLAQQLGVRFEEDRPGTFKGGA
jgi:hypothetical protein